MKRCVHHHNRRGFTVLEFLVSISVIAVLMTLIIPAVQSARGAARATVCRNNFRQVSVGLQQYATIHRQFPRTGGQAGASFVTILPWLDHAALYAALKDDTAPLSRDIYKQPSVYICPQDPVANSRPIAVSMGENCGVCVDRRKVATVGLAHDGVFLHRDDAGRSHLNSISDGLSNTACYSEIVGYPRPDKSRLIYTHATDQLSFDDVKTQAKKCRAASIGLPSWSMKRGSNWMHSIEQVNQYMHVLPPNERDCLFMSGAASMHPGGVHTALCDGSVRFVSNSIDEMVWQAVGSRNGSDGPVKW